MVEYTKRYAAWVGWTGALEVERAEFIQHPKSWRAVKRTSLAFDCRSQFNGTNPPGYASPREAVEAWVEDREREIAFSRAKIARLTTAIASVRADHSELLYAQKEATK